MYGEGVNKYGELIDLAADANIIEKSGAWYAYKGEKIGQGKENVKVLLKENNKLFNEVETKVKEYYGIPTKNDKKEEKTEK
jgi:recombination protein RecA